jgi:hypothetical protein
MKKVIKLTESDLSRIVKRVIREQEATAQQSNTRTTSPVKFESGEPVVVDFIRSQSDLDNFIDWSGDLGDVISKISNNPNKLKGFDYQTINNLAKSGQWMDPKTDKVKSEFGPVRRLSLAIGDLLAISLKYPNMDPNNAARISAFQNALSKSVLPEVKAFVEYDLPKYGQTFWNLFKDIYNAQKSSLG